MESTSISKNQRRLILLAAIIVFFVLIFVGFRTQDDLGGTYAVDVAPIDNPEAVVQGEAEISYNDDNGNFYFETITLETGEIIYLYDEAAPVNFDDSNEIHDDTEQFWNVYVNEQIDQPATSDRIKVTIVNILYWALIFMLFFIRSFIRDLISVLKITKESPDGFNRLDSKAYKLGCKIERWRDNAKHYRLLSILCKTFALFLALIWFLNQYNII